MSDTATDTTWKVLPHAAPRQLADGVWVVDGDLPMPLVHLPRRMTVVRLGPAGPGARLLVWSAIAVDDAALQTLLAHGEPAWLVVPSDHHRLDAAAWKTRFPQLQVVAPPGARDKVAEAVGVDSTAPDFGDASVRFSTVPGTQQHEAALTVQRDDGVTLVLNDVVGNIRNPAGFGGWLLRLMGLAGDHAQVPTTAALTIVKDKAALRDALLGWAALPALRRIVVSHGAVIDDDPQAVLRELAAGLD